MFSHIPCWLDGSVDTMVRQQGIMDLSELPPNSLTSHWAFFCAKNSLTTTSFKSVGDAFDCCDE
jgi:hypothetical protein